MRNAKALGLAAVLAAILNQFLPAAEATETIRWADYLIPLPHEMAVSNTVRMAPDQVSIITPPDASAMVTQAVADLRTTCRLKSGGPPAGSPFIIHIGVLSADGRINGHKVDGADRLKQTPHADQAYTIRPMGSNALVVAGLHDKGAFYGIQTLTQLLTARSTEAEVVVPMAVITDWPDMDERGLWNVGYSTPGFVAWLAAAKLNVAIFGTGLILNKGKPAACPPLPMDLIREARQRAFHLVPHIPHYDYWYVYGLTSLYPELVGKGESSRNPMYFRHPQVEQFHHARCPCASHPKFQELLADWVRSAAEQGARDVSMWLTEHSSSQCACDRCMKHGPRQFELETKATINALQQVRRDHGDLVGRIFLTFLIGDPKKCLQDTSACLDMIASTDLKAENTYSRNKAFDEYAAKGHWLSTYNGPRLVPHPLSGGGLFRFGVATPMLNSVTAYYANHYRALYCMGQVYVPANLSGNFEKTHGDYQLHALAEWTWNIKGRDPAAFARAWATRHAMPDPEQFVAWVGIVEPLEVKAGALHYGDVWGKSLAALSAKRPLPGIFPKPESLAKSLAECERAVSFARACGDPSLVEETLLLLSCFQSLRQFADLHKQIGGATQKPVDRANVEQSARATKGALNASVRHLEKLLALGGVAPKAGPDFVMDRFAKQIKSVTDQVDAVQTGMDRR